VELHVYDFDGTLFRSPDRPAWWPKTTYWIKHPASLDVPCVPEKPGSNFWISSVVSDAKKSIADSDVVTALITGRIDNSFARYRVPELLKQQGLNFDSVHLSTSTDTASFKMTVMRSLMGRHSVDAVHIWEDHATNLAKFKKMVEGQGAKAHGHLIKAPRRPCVAPEFDMRVGSLAEKYAREVLALRIEQRGGEYKSAFWRTVVLRLCKTLKVDHKKIRVQFRKRLSNPDADGDHGHGIIRIKPDDLGAWSSRGLERMFTTIAHELRHAWQDQSRTLGSSTINDDGVKGRLWKGKFIPVDTPYMERPWEVDAFKAGNRYGPALYRDMKAKDELPLSATQVYRSQQPFQGPTLGDLGDVLPDDDEYDEDIRLRKQDKDAWLDLWRERYRTGWRGLKVSPNIGKIGRQPTPESRAYALDEKNRVKHMKGARRDFRALLVMLQPLADASVAKWPAKDKTSMTRRGREFSKLVKVAPAMTAFLDTWIGTEAQHPKAKSWRGTVMYQARDVLLYGKTQKAALIEVEKQAFKGFEALIMAEAQGPYREVVPTALREYLPPKIVVEVDAQGHIQKLTDRFENEHVTLGKKVEHMHDLLRRYNAIAKKVKKDLKSSDEIIKLSALVTSILMETGIRPGKEGNGKVQMVNGEEVFVETFGAVTLGPAHVRFVRTNFVQLQFLGKMTSVNMAEIADANIIKMLQAYVDQALKKGTKFIFVTKKGVRFAYSDLQRYFRDNFAGLIPTDFRKLKATETVLAALRNEQAALYGRIRGFAKTAKGDLKEKIVEAIVEAFERAIAKSQKALSHDKATTTVKQYINPEIILRFLSTGRVEDSLEAAILSGKSKLSFDPQVFVDAAQGKTASATWTTAGGRTVRASLGDLLLELRTELTDAGVTKLAGATTRLADRWAADDTPRVAGIIQAPPKMVQAVSKWVVSTVAATVLKEQLAGQATFLATIPPRKSSPLVKKIQEVRRAIRDGAKVRVLWKLFADEQTGLWTMSWDYASQSAVEAWRGGHKPRFAAFSAQYKAGNKWLLDAMTELSRWAKGKDQFTLDNVKWHTERNAELRSYIIAGGKRPIVKVQRKAFPITKYMAGWRYEDILTDPGKIARSRKMQAEKRLADVERQWAATQRQWARDGKPDDSGAEEGTIGFLRRTFQKNLDELETQAAGLAFDDVQVNVHVHQDSRALASWNPMHHVVTVYFPRATTAWGMSGLVGSVEHELQHMTQTLLQHTFGVGNAGLPKLDTLTPGFSQWMNQTEKWMKEHPTLRTERDKAMEQLDDQGVIRHDLGHGRTWKTPPQKIDFHALDDREFFTRLQDSIRSVTPRLSKLSGKTRDNAIDLYTYVIPIPSSNDKDWHEKVKALGGYDELSSVMHGPSPFFKALKNVPSARGKYVRAVKELRKALGYKGSNKAAAVTMLATRWLAAAGTAKDITDNLRPLAQAVKDYVAALNRGLEHQFPGDSRFVRSWASTPWVEIITRGRLITDGILSTRSIPRRDAKAMEMAYRLFANARRMPKDAFKWWDKNEKRITFIMEGALKWPEKVEGGDELFKVGKFRVHNTVGATGPVLKSLKDAIAKVQRAVKKNAVPGFARTLYGDIHVVSRITKAHHAAWYHPGDDSLYLRLGKALGMDDVHSMIHELGHRYWAKFASTEQQRAWFRHHLDVERQDVEVELPHLGDSIPFMRIPGVKTDPVITKEDATAYYFDVEKKGVKHTYTMSRRKMQEAYRRQAKRTQSFPTPYSATSKEEHFCDALGLISLKKLAPEHADPFKAIWG
jgi:hypothetical protein